jgi:hypothetical protein
MRATQETDGTRRRFASLAQRGDVAFDFGLDRCAIERKSTMRAPAGIRPSDKLLKIAYFRCPGTRETKEHGKQNAYRRHTSGRDPGGGATWSSG